jgi:DNA-binding LacI/PurR family transcriptional regulator
VALQAAGLPDKNLVAHADWGVEGGANAMRALLRLGKRRRPTAVICSSDLMAIGALLEAKAAGLHVPHDMSIVGFDGIDATKWTEPPLTTLAQPIQDIAHAAIQTLDLLIASAEGASRHSLFRPRLISRGSTAPSART